MYKLIAGVLSITILAPVALLTGGGVSADNTLEVLAAEIFDIPVATNKQDVVDTNVSLDAGGSEQVSAVNARLRAFVEEVYTGQPNVLTGIFVDGDFEMDIVQQPVSQPGYISSQENAVTDFRMARDYGTIGLLAHNFLAGEAFFQLDVGQTIYLVYGNSEVESFTIVDVKQFQALSPNSPYSNFVDLENSEQVSAADLFYQIYGQEDALILQTCIENNGISTWGRLFIIAVPGAIPTDAGIAPF